MPRLLVIAISIAAAAAVAACNPAQGAMEEPPLAGAAIGGPFTLTDQNGKARTWDDFRGRYAAVYFGYTYCPDICPTDVQRTAQGLRRFQAESPELAEKVQQIFVSVDPARDTPQVLQEFTSAFGPDIVGLTGTPEQIDAAAKAFKVFHGKGKVEEGGAYLVDHSNITYLFDPSGKPLATLPTDQGAEAVAQELAKWVR
ncbi:SCO family protein [Altererythrobacter aerius]|uniref:SCO family protein n=2 Tax=Tsuneonella aeria TaxID=1837929 RepID=A0A6I4TE37_9SPHN|nr:SCO family protein [Tsuneonella aeria]